MQLLAPPPLAPTPEGLRTTDLDFSYTFHIVEKYAGIGLLEKMATTDLSTLEHELGVGQLAAEFVHEADIFEHDFLEEVCGQVAATGGTHDTGKWDGWVQEMIHQPTAYDAETRQKIRDVHCALGENVLTLLALSTKDLAASLTLERMAFVARHHHSPIPEDYHKMPLEESYRWSLTHLTKYADVLQAVWFDPARKYLANREKALANRKPPELVFDIVMKETGGKNPIILDAEIDIRPLVAARLGLRSDYGHAA
jgi:hypothetical protein